MYLRSGSYYFVEPGTERWINLGRDYVAAMSVYAKMTAEDVPSFTVSQLIDRYLREVAPTKAPRTYQDNVRQAKFLRAFFGQMSLEDVTQQDIYQYLDERGKRSEVQANRELAMLSHMFKKAIRWGVIAAHENPCAAIEKLHEAPRRRYVADWEFDAFKAHAGPFLAAYTEFKYLTGLRQGDILALRLDQLRDDGIYVKQRKTGREIIIEWSVRLVAAVAAVRAIPRSIRGFYMFCTRKGAPYSSDGFRSMWQRKMRSALKDGVLTERFREHDLRAKAASDVDRPHAESLLDHADGRVTDRHYLRKPKEVKPTS